MPDRRFAQATLVPQITKEAGDLVDERIGSVWAMIAEGMFR